MHLPEGGPARIVALAAVLRMLAALERVGEWIGPVGNQRESAGISGNQRESAQTSGSQLASRPKCFTSIKKGYIGTLKFGTSCARIALQLSQNSCFGTVVKVMPYESLPTLALSA